MKYTPALKMVSGHTCYKISFCRRDEQKMAFFFLFKAYFLN